MATATKTPARVNKKLRSSRQVSLLGVTLTSDGDAIVDSKTFGDGEGFIKHVSCGAVAWKLPFVQAVYFLLADSRIIALLYSSNQRRWRDATTAMVPSDRRSAVPEFSLLQAIVSFFSSPRVKASWVPCPSAFVLSDSIRFKPGGTVEYERPDGTRVETAIRDLPCSREPIVLSPLRGTHAIRGKGSNTFNLETTDIRRKERFQYVPQDDRYDRHANTRELRPTESDEFGLRYLQDREVLFAEAPIPFRQRAEGSRRWTVDLPQGTVSYKHSGHLLLEDKSITYTERFGEPDGPWHVLDAGRWHVETNWVLGAGQLSTELFGVLELQSNGNCVFLKQFSFQDGVEIDCRGPGGIHLVRVAGGWLELFEHGELLGMGYYARRVFPKADGGYDHSWAFGCEVDLPPGESYEFPWFPVIFGGALLWLALIAGPLTLLAEVSFFVIAVFPLVLKICGTAVVCYLLWVKRKQMVAPLDRFVSSILTRLAKLLRIT